MNNNPFESMSTRNVPLALELCQRIHYGALCKAAQHQKEDCHVPKRVSLTQLRDQAYWQGMDGYLLHPADIATIFCGVTMSVYQFVEHCYVSRLGRSIHMVWEIVRRMAQLVDVEPITYEALWGICIHLDERRCAETTVTIEQQDVTWILTSIYPEVHIRAHDETYQPRIDCVIEVPSERVLAFCVARWAKPETGLRVLYDAFVAQRNPAPVPDAVAGLKWRIPMSITFDNHSVLPDVQTICHELGICHTQSVPSSLLSRLHDSWDKDLAHRTLDYQVFERIFDTYLRRIHGYGPHTIDQEQKVAFAHRTGYNRDPAWQFPSLRRLLPAQSGIVTDDGTVVCDGLHFEDALLPLWIGQSVTVRRSRANAAAAFISINEDWLCLAMARELRRADGTYRTHLPGRC